MQSSKPFDKTAICFHRNATSSAFTCRFWISFLWRTVLSWDRAFGSCETRAQTNRSCCLNMRPIHWKKIARGPHSEWWQRPSNGCQHMYGETDVNRCFWEQDSVTAVHVKTPFWVSGTVLRTEGDAAEYRWRVTCHIRRCEIETDHSVNITWSRSRAREGSDSRIRVTKRDGEAAIRLGTNCQGCVCKERTGEFRHHVLLRSGESMSAKQPASFRRKGLSTSKQRNKQQVGRWSHSWRHG